MDVKRLQISVIGAGSVDEEGFARARRVGELIAAKGATLICGGLGGAMEGACRGASEAGGLTVGIIPGAEKRNANRWARAVVATGMGHARNTLVVQSGDAVVALPGSHGTLSEIGLALKMGRPVVSVGAWGDIHGVVALDTPEEAVAEAIRLAEAR